MTNMEGGGGTLQEWKLYRQFQKTLDSIKIEDHEARFSDLLEIKEIEDEGEQIGGREDHQLTLVSVKLQLKSYFNQWKDLVDLASKQRRKAEFYYRFTSLEKGIKRWKIFTKHEKDRRERKKWSKAIAFDEMRLLRYVKTRYTGMLKMKESQSGFTVTVATF